MILISLAIVFLTVVVWVQSDKLLDRLDRLAEGRQ